METKYCKETVGWIIDHFEAKDIFLDLLRYRIIFKGKLRNDSTLGLLPWKNEAPKLLEKTSNRLKEDYNDYTIKILTTLFIPSEEFAVLSTPAEGAEKEFYSANGRKIPLFY